MNFALNELHITILNLALVGLLAIFLGLSIEDAYKFHVADDVVPAAPDRSSAPVARPDFVKRQRVFYNAITDRDIFNLAPPPASAAASENLNVRLLGTSFLTSGKPFVIIEDQSGKQDLYRKGDEIPGVGPVLEIQRNRAIVLHNGHRVSIDIPPDLGLPPEPEEPFFERRRGLKQPRPLAMGERAAPGVRELGLNKYAVARATVVTDLQNPGPLLSQIRAVPNIQHGAANGFRLSEIEPGSVFDQIGLEDGDLLTAVSGQPVGDPIKAISMLQTLGDQSSVTINVIRDGAPVQINYTIH
jgi:general secretion pathway protein C